MDQLQSDPRNPIPTESWCTPQVLLEHISFFNFILKESSAHSETALGCKTKFIRVSQDLFTGTFLIRTKTLPWAFPAETYCKPREPSWTALTQATQLLEQLCVYLELLLDRWFKQLFLKTQNRRTPSLLIKWTYTQTLALKDSPNISQTLWFNWALKPQDGKEGKEVSSLCTARSRENKHGAWMITRTGSVWFTFLHLPSTWSKFNGFPTGIWNSIHILKNKTSILARFVIWKATKCFSFLPKGM